MYLRGRRIGNNNGLHKSLYPLCAIQLMAASQTKAASLAGKRRQRLPAPALTDKAKETESLRRV